MSGFNPRPVRVGFVVDNMALGHDFIRILLLSLISITPSMPRTHSLIHYQRKVTLKNYQK